MDTTPPNKGDLTRAKSINPPVAKRTSTAGPKKLQHYFTPMAPNVIRGSSDLRDNTHLRVPVLNMSLYCGPTSRSTWHVDAVTLGHNAFRRELVDLYLILSTIGQGPGAVMASDIAELQRWWKVAYGFFQSFFEMESKALFPWIEKKVPRHSDDDELLKGFVIRRTILLEELQRVSQIFNEIGSESPGAIFGKLYTAFDSLVPQIADYFTKEEECIPELIKKRYTLDDRFKMDKECLAVFMEERLGRKTRDIPRLNIILLIRWMKNPRQMKAWISQNLNNTAKSVYPKWRRAFEEEHRSIVQVFKERSKY